MFRFADMALEGVLTAQTAENTFKQILNVYFASPTSKITWLTVGLPEDENCLRESEMLS